MRQPQAKAGTQVKVVFCEPPILLPNAGQTHPAERLYGCSYELYHFPDLANLYCASMCEKAGFEVRITDAVLEGLSPESFFKRIKSLNADAYVIHSVLLSKATDIEAIRQIRKLLPEALVVVHGPEPTRRPDQYLLDEKIVVVRGEAEIALVDLLLQKEARGISRLENQQVISTPISKDVIELDSLPMPARNHPDIAPHTHRFFNPKFESGPFTILMASRGCSFRCLFCVPNSISFAREIEHLRAFGKKPKVAKASAQKVIDEFEAVARMGYKSVAVIDDQFLWDKKRTLEICENVKNLGLEWGILSRADFLDDPEIGHALKGAGCTSVDIGVESLSQQTLDYVNKDLKVETVHKAINVCKSCGLEPKLNIVLGASPTESATEIRKTVTDLRMLNVQRVMFSIATPFKGTKFYEHCDKNGYLVDRSDFIDPAIKSMISYDAPGMSKSELERETRRANRTFYLHPTTIWRRLLSIRSFQELKNNIKIAWRLF